MEYEGIIYIGNPEDNNVLATTKGNIKIDDLPLNKCYVIARRDFEWRTLTEKGIVKEGEKTIIDFYCPQYAGSWFLLCGDCWLPFDCNLLEYYFYRA